MSSNIVAASFHCKSQSFYYMNDGDYVMSFSVEDESWRLLKFPENKSKDTKDFHSSYSWKWINKMIDGLDLEEDERVTFYGLTYKDKSYQVEHKIRVLNVSSTSSRIRRPF